MELLLLGAALGTAAGISPGPLLALVIAATLERGLAAGLRIAAAPVLSDGPVILISLLALGRVSPSFLRGITVLGGAYVAYLGLRSIRDAGRSATRPVTRPGSAGSDFGQGILVNLLNPHPWIGWTTVIGPLVLESWRRARWEALGFVTLFYLTIVGSKMLLALVVSRGRRRLEGRWYAAVLVVCGLALVVLGLLLVRQGLTVDPDTMARHLAISGPARYQA